MYDHKRYDTRMRDPDPRGRRKPWRAVLMLAVVAAVGAVALRAWDASGPESLRAGALGRLGDGPARGEPDAHPDASPSPPPSVGTESFRGRVLLGAATALPHVEVVELREEGVGRAARTDEQGVFRLESVEPGALTLAVRGIVDLGLGAFAPVVATGAGEARLELPSGYALYLRRDRDASLQEEARVQVARSGGGPRAEGTWAAGRAGALVTGLAGEDRYDVLVRVAGFHRACLLEGVEPGRDASLALGPAAALHGRVKLPAGASQDGLAVTLSHGNLLVQADLFAYGGFQAKDLPQESSWNVRAVVRTAEGELTAQARDVIAGEVDRIELEPR